MNRFVILVVATALSAGSANLAYADDDDQPASDWMPAQQVIEKALNSGYTRISKIKADDGRWEGEGIKNGRRMEFLADPRTGEIISEKLD